MAGIKRTPADAAFSLCVRARVNFRCERCGAAHNQHSQGLHASHHHRRGNWSVRFNPMNAEALCYGCHNHVGGTEGRMREVMTDAEYDLLLERKNDLALGRLYRKTQGVGEIAAHYREEFRRMMARRDAGEHGRLDFEEFF